ncbi:uncharacterized protein CANTADRAFT_30702, partial [Suhomyces tanzawaensis NRRL Y-17324]
PTTPISSPKIQESNPLRPSTPPRPLTARGGASDRRNRLSASFLKTPEQSVEGQLPFSPALKRTNSGNLKSPDYKLNHNTVSSPYSSGNVLKTPRHTGYDSDEGGKGYYQKSKLQKTPQFFSSAKKLFQNDDQAGSPTANKEDLSEISSQLKSRLSSALGKIQRDDSQASKISFTELTFDSSLSPTKKVRQGDQPPWTPSTSVQRANLNLQTLQQSPMAPPHSGSSVLHQSNLFPTYNANSPLKLSPLFNSEVQGRSAVNLPSPDEESSAHSALLAALSRQRIKSRTSFSSPSRKRASLVGESPHPQKSTNSDHHPIQLPSLNVALKPSEINNEKGKSNNEQDAVLSLMSLSSPQAIKFSHSRNHSLNDTSPISPGESLSLLASPINSQSQSGPLHPILPPISGLIQSSKKKSKNGAGSPSSKHTTIDNDADLTENDETDID